MSIQCFIDRDGSKARLIAVSDEAIYFDSMPRASAEQAVAELQGGRTPAAVFASSATSISLRELKRASLDAHGDDIEFTANAGGKDVEETLSFESEEVRRDVFMAIERMSGGHFKHHEDAHNAARAAFGPLMTLTVLGFGTWMLANAASAIQAAGEYEVSGRRKGLKEFVASVLELLGPTGVYVIGGTLFGLSLVYLISRIRTPPHLHILQAERFSRPGPITLAIKYGTLAAVWGLALRIAF